MENIKRVIEVVGAIVDVSGVAVIVTGLLAASVTYVRHYAKEPAADSFRNYRQAVGKAILLGLEFLVAGDIIRTVAVSPTVNSVIVLGLIVLIRTFLSISIEVELESRWPWQKPSASVSSNHVGEENRKLS